MSEDLGCSCYPRGGYMCSECKAILLEWKREMQTQLNYQKTLRKSKTT